MAKKKKSPPMALKQDSGDWIFSYADLMTLLLCFFILFFHMSDEDETKKEDIKKEMQQVFEGEDLENEFSRLEGTAEAFRAFFLVVSTLNIQENPKTLSDKINAIYDQSESLKEAQKSVKEYLDSNRRPYADGESDPAAARQSIVEFIFPDKAFASRSVQLTFEAQKQMHLLEAYLQKSGQLTEIEVAGHIQRGAREDAYALSLNRAAQLASRLKQKIGTNVKIRASSYGSDLPIAQPPTDTANNRIEILLKFER